jgi:GTP-binding protein EngB required for normal cell division
METKEYIELKEEIKRLATIIQAHKRYIDTQSRDTQLLERGQLAFPLTQNTVDLINESIKDYVVEIVGTTVDAKLDANSKTVPFSSGTTGTIIDSRVTPTSKIIFSFSRTSGTSTTAFTVTKFNGSFIITNTSTLPVGQITYIVI